MPGLACHVRGAQERLLIAEKHDVPPPAPKQSAQLRIRDTPVSRWLRHGQQKQGKLYSTDINQIGANHRYFPDSVRVYDISTCAELKSYE